MPSSDWQRQPHLRRPRPGHSSDSVAVGTAPVGSAPAAGTVREDNVQAGSTLRPIRPMTVASDGAAGTGPGRPDSDGGADPAGVDAGSWGSSPVEKRCAKSVPRAGCAAAEFRVGDTVGSATS